MKLIIKFELIVDILWVYASKEVMGFEILRIQCPDCPDVVDL